ncbi:MAG: LPXTG cell wall anchor domain-containing protein [Bacteroidetes bacterium]|nr:LPXTG cell wall anchor domain-containing protein [Bacteroidota bacterium]
MEKKRLIGSQITIVLWLLVAAISCIEVLKQFEKGGFKNPWIYVFGALFLGSIIMYFYIKKQRFSQK